MNSNPYYDEIFQEVTITDIFHISDNDIPPTHLLDN